ncbi:MAG: Gfo/Idh/MocA family oxidoreductase [Xanthomonadales bacterium]
MNANGKVRWGILSTARIGREHVIPALQASETGEVVAIASRDADNARRVAAELGIPRAWGDYDELLADETVDAIYNPLPNHLHVEWSIRALEAGKHVLCEKPIGLSAADARTLLDAAHRHPRLKVMEAFMYRFHPQWRFAREAVAEGRIGRLQAIHSVFSYYNDEPDNVRNVPEWGGGGLMDIGCYAISTARLLFGSEPRRVLGTLEYDPAFGTDRLCTALMAFDGGTAAFSCGTQMAPYQRVNALGTSGRVEVEIPFNAPADRPCRVWVQGAEGTQEWRSGVHNQYTLMGDAFARAVLDDTEVPTPLEDAVANMRVIDAIARSAKTGGWVELD